MFALAYHLSHSVQSMFQTLGLNNQHYDGGLRLVALAWATILFIGYVSIPVAALSGILKLPAGVR
jgi:succinate dehydrogenase / fumarate reductase cytochrome b subunit